MNQHGEPLEEDLLGNSQNLSKAALLAQPAVTEKLCGAFPRWSSVRGSNRLADHFRGSGKALGALGD